MSNDTAIETTDSTGLTAFGADGFTVGADTDYSDTTGTGMAAWSWKAGGAPTATNSAGAGATPTAGSVKIDGSNLGSALAGSIPALKLSANTTAGFSIVNWNGTEAIGTVAHGLSQAPEIIIVKDADSARNWPVSTENATGRDDGYLLLNLNNAEADSSYYWGAPPGASVFTLGDSANTNDDASMIAYCFHSVEGYSKVGSYVGNSNTDGPFIYTGFKPAFLMVKLVTNLYGAWVMFDNKRDPDNPTDRVFYANGNAISTDVSSYSPYDLLSNGFKSRIPGGNGNEASYNSNGETYIYLAFAESPFKTSNAR